MQFGITIGLRQTLIRFLYLVHSPVFHPSLLFPGPAPKVIDFSQNHFSIHYLNPVYESFAFSKFYFIILR